MFGKVTEPTTPEPAQSASAAPTSVLAAQAQEFFSSFGARVSTGAKPRPARPGTVPVRTLSPAPAAASSRSLFGHAGDDAAARARELEMAEANIVDDTFDDFDSPGC